MGAEGPGRCTSRRERHCCEHSSWVPRPVSRSAALSLDGGAGVKVGGVCDAQEEGPGVGAGREGSWISLARLHSWMAAWGFQEDSAVTLEQAANRWDELGGLAADSPAAQLDSSPLLTPGGCPQGLLSPPPPCPRPLRLAPPVAVIVRKVCFRGDVSATFGY